MTIRAFPLMLLVMLLGPPRTAAADFVRLKSGDVLHGTIVSTSGAEVVIEHPDLGRLTIARERLAPLQEADPAAGAPTADDPPAATRAPAVEPEKPRSEWSKRLVLGGGLSHDDEGRKWKFNMRGRLQRDRPDGVIRIDGSWIYSEDEDGTDDNYATVSGEHRWLIPDDPVFFFVTGRYDFNQFRDWRHRLTSHGGVGYAISLSDNLTISPVAGAGARKDFQSENEDLLAEGLLGFDLDWKPLPRHTLEARARYFPALNDSRSRYTVNGEWVYLLDAELNLSFNAAIDYEYDTQPDAGFPNDVYYLTFGLQLDF